ncbi:AcrR family transcriptional regulator [Anaerosolibacter carboniphilus]|uniref:AcrR family transcriptional regulator n=1 Tax=Anaerosolibacter carboniphilus TaxID=1417629 RepID=A0A841KY82_9FIRM|nr:TetR/AcrR family transcriptional regulator [Anaerosolibacter carboniphilus]MBB6215872.1 AcrR family transcriptional regulator [Anaerosolibacter carboniphilus]
MTITKDEIFKKAIELFKKNGFEGTSVNAICEACNVTKGSFYHHFKSKDEILLNFYRYSLKDMADILLNVLDEESDRQKIWTVLEYSIDLTIGMGADLLKALILIDIKNGNKILNPYSILEVEGTEDYSRLLMHLVEKAQKSGAIRNDVQAEELVFAFTSALIGVAVNWSASGGSYDEKQELRRLFDIIFQ